MFDCPFDLQDITTPPNADRLADLETREKQDVLLRRNNSIINARRRTSTGCGPNLLPFLNNYSATKPIPVPIRTRFDGTKSQLKSWRITVEDRLFSDCAHLTPLQKWIFVYDGLTDQIQKRLSYYFESGETREWNVVAFLNHLEVLYSDSTSIKVERLELRRLRYASDEPFSDYLVRFEAQMARAHRSDAPEDEKVELLHQSISQELDELCRHCTIPTHSYAEAVAVFKHQEAEQGALEFRNLIRTMTTPDPNTPTLEAVSEKGTNTTVVARTSFSGKSRKSRPGGKKGVKTTEILKDAPESQWVPDQSLCRRPTEPQGRQCALPPTSSRGTAGVRRSEVVEGTSECGESDCGSTKEAPSVASSGEGVSIRSQGLSDSTGEEYKVIEDNMETKLLIGRPDMSGHLPFLVLARYLRLQFFLLSPI
ncbi:hypothetical protein E4U16_002213 [Claviceps sp. LM84 group G4]|nr:hypothetical protein E4U16_002213 [Claviceps sp. LM84 group G4]